MKLDGATILVTGGAGFIGSHLADALLLAGARVRVLDDLSTGHKQNLESAITLLEGSVLDPEAVGEATAGCDFVFHLATRSVRQSLRQPTIVHDVNVTGTLNVLKAARQAKVKRFLYCSSSEVNGTGREMPMGEDYNFRPETIYGASKLAGEYYALVFQRAGWLPVVVARPHNTYGPRAHHDGAKGEVIPRFILQCLQGRPLTIYGDGEQTRDFTYVADTVRVLIDLLKCDRALGEVYNVCRGKETTVDDLAREILRLTDSRSTLTYLPGRPSDVLRLWGDNTKLRALLGYSPAIELADGLPQTIDFYRRVLAQSDDLGLEAVAWNDQPSESWLA